MQEYDNIFDLEIEAACREFSLDQDLVKAICRAESAFETWAARFEPGWKYFYFCREFAEKLSITVETEEVLQATSWGLGQVMGYVAREHGFQNMLQQLCQPQIGLYYCCKHLNKLSKRYPDESDIIAAYNAGSARMTSGGLYVNQRYVDKVSSYLREIRKKN